MKYKIFLFDADGVTLQGEGLFTDKAKEKGLISSTEKTAPFFKGVFQDCLVGKADLKKELAKVIRDWAGKARLMKLLSFGFRLVMT